MKRLKCLIPGSVIFCGLIAVANASSQTQAAEDGANADTGAWAVEARGWGRFIFTTDFEKSGNGEFSVLRTGTRVSLKSAVFDDSEVSIDFLYGFNHFNFGGRNSFFAGSNDPFSDVQQVALGAGFFDRINDEWAWGASVRGEFFGESGVSFSDASSIIGTGLAQYQVNEDLAVGFGLRVRSEIEDDTLFLPLVTLDWQIDEVWKLTVGEAEGASNLQALLSYEVSDAAVVGFGVEYVRNRFRLDNDSIRRGAVIEDTSLPIFVNFTFKPTENATVVLEGGVIAFQEFEVEDQFGRNGRDFDSDATGFLGISLNWVF